jgi:gag-polyprotein putative aspartyl protease
MRLGVVGLSVPLFLCLTISVLADQLELRRRSDAHQTFLLRDALMRHPRLSDFYEGEVACAFNDTATCEQRFKKVLDIEPKSAATKKIHHILAYAAMREGRYARSLHEIDALLAIDPNDRDAKDTRPFIEALSHFPDQAVQVSGASKATVQMDKGKLPLLINGKKASYFFDTGANLSTLSESDALRFGMEIQAVNSSAGSTDINGNKVFFRIALAKSLALGGIELSNVAFLVASNEQQPFADMEPGQRGLIGLPVLRALGSITWTREGVFEADRLPAPAHLPAANLCFDDLDVITQAWFERHALPFVLDTGAETSHLWPKFATVARDLIRKSGTHEFHTVTGMGGGQKFEVTIIPRVMLELGGMSVALQPAHILETQQRTSSKWFYGNLGIDLLRQAQKVTIDFKTMTLKLDNAAEPRMHRE